MTALVIGASGTTGSRLVQHLINDARPVVAAGRRGVDIPGARSAIFDWHDTSTYSTALDGVDRIYLVPPIGDAEPQNVVIPFLRHASGVGVRRVVLLSSSAIPAGGPATGAVHAALPDLVDEWAVLRPSWFMQNFIGDHAHAQSIREDDAIFSATGTAGVGFIDADDIARVAATTLFEEQPRNDELVLTGPESLSYNDIAAVMTEVTGRTITHRQLSGTEMRARLTAFVPPAFAEMLAAMDESIARGAEDRITDTVERVTGQAPTSFRECVHRSSRSAQH